MNQVQTTPFQPSSAVLEEAYQDLDLSTRRVKDSLIQAYRYFSSLTNTPCRLPAALCDIANLGRLTRHTACGARLTVEQYHQLAYYVNAASFLSQGALYCFELLDTPSRSGLEVDAAQQFSLKANLYASGLHDLITEFQSTRVTLSQERGF